MVIGFDIGNTHIVTGIYNEAGKLISTFRIATNDKMTEDEYFSYFRNITEYNNISIDSVNDILISSVVPNIITTFQFFSRKYFNVEPLLVDIDKVLPFTFSTNINNTGFGADRIIDIVEGMKKYPNRNLVIFDFGTATTYDVLKKGVYVGGGILPGIDMSINALCGNTAKLPRVKFTSPSSILGTDTIKQIQAAIFFGYAGQIKHIIKKIKEEIKEDIFVLATGGLGKILSAEIDEIDEYDYDLSLKGLYSLYELNKKK
ncbi:MAG: type III pantothenate kinase [Fusobacterium sp.]|uniref:type III pantothenate kinase n=1 Tax=Fusobacterium sp. TaxID=68766 RepID=UPI0026DC5A36|nr:type III pantothenate kinase [Fusobacterium sp.]MDO4690309.1 type III pantothenate kinase [Fusobacterium sp.]